MKLIVCTLGLCVLSIAAFFPNKKGPDESDWPAYGGNNAGNRYSSLTQINLGNVASLKLAWQYDAAKDEKPMELQCQPIMIDGILYGTTPLLKLFALKADTGEELWKFDPFENQSPRYHPSRGIMYWKEGNQIFYTAGSKLLAIDAKTGKLVTSFGQNGSVDLHIGLGDGLDHDVNDLTVEATSPGVIYRNTIVMGSRVGEFGNAAPGSIRGIDVRTGALKWVFHTIPHPGEFGYDTWPKNAWKFMGAVNNWSGMVLDETRGTVYFGTGSPSVDFYGADRPGINLFSDCIIALDAETGKRKWHFQTVHHDLWDRDIPCPPNLTTIQHNGKATDVVVQTTKDGLVYVLNQDTGQSIFPIEERPVPTTGMPGEKPWPKQPFPTKPAPFARQVFTENDITNRSPEAHAAVKKRFLETKTGGKYTPPSREGMFILGMGGGAIWGGNAIDPQGILYQNSNEMAWDLKLLDYKPRTSNTSQGQSLYITNCAVCHGQDRKGSGQEYPALTTVADKYSSKDLLEILKSGKGRMPSFQHISEEQRKAIVSFLLNKEPSGEFHSVSNQAATPKKGHFPYSSPYINNGWTRALDPDGYPAIKPPWGTLNAINLNTGEYVWTVPLGEFPELTKKGIPITGTESYGGPIVTAGGLVFIAGTKDERFRAFDQKTGKIVWEYQLPAAGFATPMTYEIAGKQYVVLAVGGAKNGHKPGGWYMAFSL
ncbi:MAG: PQQ-binding-like beta-propeller repeat protein [Siphonobacter sp.]